MWLAIRNKKNTVISLPDIIYSCAEVVSFISKHAPHLEINRIKKINVLEL